MHLASRLVPSPEQLAVLCQKPQPVAGPGPLIQVLHRERPSVACDLSGLRVVRLGPFESGEDVFRGLFPDREVVDLGLQEVVVE